MKNLKKSSLLTAALVLMTLGLSAQNGSAFGLKGGLNYSANGDYFESIGQNAKNPDRNLGYHFGVFGKIGDRIFFRPELVYTTTKSDYDDDQFSVKKLDAPLLVGVKVLGPISVFGGPALQYILDTEFDGITIDNVEDDFSVGVNFGIGLNFDKVGIDLRYERGLNENEASFFNNNSRVDTRPDQLILGLSIAL